MRVIGVDVSHWEGNINWGVASPAIGFVYYKATDGIDFVDSQFGNNMDDCNDHGVPHAPFHWFQPSENPVLQAQFFIETCEGGGYKRYIADFEQPGCNDWNMKTFLNECERLTGIKPAIYTSYGFWDSIYPRPTWANQYDLIVAHYTAAHNPTLPSGWSTWKIWQNTDYFFFPGCNDIADGDWFNGTMQQCRDWFGNYHATLPVESENTQMRVIVPSLRIRSAPSTISTLVGTLYSGEVVEVLDAGGADAWVKHSRGWSCYKNSMGKYLEPV